MRELTEPDCRAFLGRHRFGVISLAKDGAAYAVPLFFAYDGRDLFFHSRPGAKDAFLEGTSEGCFLVVQVETEDDWTSVQAIGKVERVSTNADAERAFAALAENPFPPEFGVTAKGTPARSAKASYLWMMRPRKITGRCSQSLVRAH